MNLGDINGLFRRVLGRNSLLVLDGEEHMRQRRLLLPPFHGERIAQHYGAMLTAAEENVATWPTAATFALQPQMQSMTLDVILGAVFGLRPGPRRTKLRALLVRLLERNAIVSTAGRSVSGRHGRSWTARSEASSTRTWWRRSWPHSKPPASARRTRR